MSVREVITEYMNLIARACAIVYSYPKDINNLYTVEGFNDCREVTWQDIAKAWLTKRSVSTFLAYVASEIDQLNNSVEANRYSKALFICLWLEQNITYEDRSASVEKAFFSVSPLFPIGVENRFVIIDAMNTNYKETGVQIIPKFEICQHWAEEGRLAKGRPNPFANRDVFDGLNGKTKKVSFIRWNKNFYIHNVVLPSRFIPVTEDVLNIAFCPLTDNYLLKEEYVTVDGQNVIKVTGLKKPKILLKRLEADWLHACGIGKADIVFYPEALGSNFSERTTGGGKYQFSIHEMAKKASKQGNRLPLLTVLPSYCKEGENKATLLDRNGFIIGKQSKYKPYYDLQHNRKEYLKECQERHYYLIHIPKLHRIAVLICADFLAYDKNDAKKLFTEAGCTLLLVPSFSHGETDFVNTIQALKPYGTTVIWGNSCGAAGEQQIIGGCCIAGFDKVFKFNDSRDCGASCEGVESCAFIVSVPLRFAGSRNPSVTDITVKRI